MESNDLDLRAENNRKWQLSRRQLLKIIGAAGITAATAPLITSLASGDSPSATTEQTEDSGKRLRRWSMIIDLRKCDGCQSIGEPPRCTTACIEGHFAPEPMEWIQVFEEELPGGGTQFIPTPCMACQNPPCVAVCPVGATWSAPEGHVLIDQNRCIGCRSCMSACPYDRRFFNWGDPPVPPQALFVDYKPERQVPLRKGVTSKCDWCVDLARGGRIPHCAQGCPNGAIFYGDLEEDIATNGEEVIKLSRFLSENNAFRLKEELGTEPRVWYIQGHGEEVGRDPMNEGREPTVWPWKEIKEGTKPWKRDGR